MCYFVTGETRDACATGAVLGPATSLDPNATNDRATVDTKMVRPHRD